ncbi:MAG: HDOD domain-containing protein [Deltaproteobacteria bacterium]|nr:HDOD domain-containing protein [Deltaproteobacteria bacterium]
MKRDDADIPLLPVIAAEAMTLLRNPMVDFRDVTALIEKDQRLAGQLIKIANSPFYRSLYEVRGIRRAVTVIGLRGVTELIASLAIGQKIFANKMFEEKVKGLWEHSIGCAFLAQEIGGMRSDNAQDAFLVGLLHDIGKPLVLNIIAGRMKRRPEEYPAGPEMEAVADELMDEFHVAAGRSLGEHWRFPDNIMHAIRYHHNPLKEDIPFGPALLAGVVDLYAHKFGLGVEPRDTDCSSHPWVSAFEFSAGELREIESSLCGNARMIAMNTLNATVEETPEAAAAGA